MKRKENKNKRNNNLAIWPSYNTSLLTIISGSGSCGLCLGMESSRAAESFTTLNIG